MTKGILIVSHSALIAQGLATLIQEVARDVPIRAVGGTADGGIGTDFDALQSAVEEMPADRLLVFYDLGSAKMNLEMVRDFSDKDLRIYEVALIEGAYNAAALLQVDLPLEEIEAKLEALRLKK